MNLLIKFMEKVFGASSSKKSIKIGKLKTSFLEIEDFEMKSSNEC